MINIRNRLFRSFAYLTEFWLLKLRFAGFAVYGGGNDLTWTL